MAQLFPQAAVEELQSFISGNPDAREMRKALALKLVYQDYGYVEIEKILDVSMGSISGWKKPMSVRPLSGCGCGIKDASITREALQQILHLVEQLFAKGHLCEQVLQVLMPA